MSTFETIYVIGHTIGSFLLLMIQFLVVKNYVVPFAKKEKTKMIKKDILSTPKHGWCNFHLADEEKEFNAALSYLTDVMYDTLKMCLAYLQTGAGAAAVMYDREGEGTFLFVISDYDVYILDENLTGGMVHFENLRADDICENILGCYYADTIGWLNFANMNEQSEKEYGLKSGAISLMRKKNTGSWMPGKQEMITKKAR